MVIQCALCKEMKEGKSNTHYLTNAVIKSCLNEHGRKENDYAYAFDISENPKSIDFNFQRATNSERIEDEIERKLTEEEIENSKATLLCSVNDVFCEDCEDKFTKIEHAFTQKLLSKFRNKDLSQIDFLEFPQVREIRLFFLLQVWRTSVCERNFKLSAETKEKLRNIIYHHETVSDEEINHFPLSVTYLQTLPKEGDKGNEEYTRNFVGVCPTNKPNIILMNDFVIQFYESDKDIHYESLYGINEQTNYKSYINTGGDNFKFKIIHDEKRKEFDLKVLEPSVKYFTGHWVSNFMTECFKNFQKYPTDIQKKEFLSAFAPAEASNNPLRNTAEYINGLIKNIIDKHKKEAN